MKLIAAYIHPHMLEKVADALRAQKVHGVTVLQCQGFGRRIDGKAPHYEDPAVEFGYAPKVKLEIVCTDDDVWTIVRTIMQSAHTGHPGDGKVFVTEVTHAFDIRTTRDGEAIL